MSIINRIQKTVLDDPTISRCKLSRRVCEWLDWRSEKGRLKEMSCRKALCELNRKNILDLPEPAGVFGFEAKKKQAKAPDIPHLEQKLKQLGEVRVTPVSSRYAKESRIWFALMDRYHYLGNGPLCGSQIRYLVQSPDHGCLGALAFSSAPFALKDRDAYIGWTEAARRANLKYLVCNSRFLILPTVKVKNLASHVLSEALSRLPDDWEQRYGVRPSLVETFVDSSRYDGACYKAANWKEIGETSGRRDGIRKRIFVHPLDRKWRKSLCREPETGLCDMPRPESFRHWAEEEFGTVRIFDDRLKERLYKIAQDFYGKPLANIPEASGSKAGTVGAYRFFENKKISMDIILDGHAEATIERIREHPIVLAPQDTTTITYTHPKTEGFGPVNGKKDKAVGILLHDTLAFTEEGTPLGVLDAQCWARDPKEIGKKHQRHKKPIEEKESMKWLRSFRRVEQIQKQCPDTMLVSIGDRESDVYELFQDAVKKPDNPKLLVRLCKGTQRKVSEEEENLLLWEFMAKQEISGSLKIHVPRSGSRKARDTWIDIRFSEVELIPPKRLAKCPPIKAWAVYTLEREDDETPPKPIEWMLLTTVPVTSLEDAKKRVEWYTGRWGIEVYHRTLKSGCRIKERQLGSAENIEKCLGIDMVVAWRIYHLTMLGRETPDLPCTVFFKDVEWKALCVYVSKNPVPPEEPPSLSKAMYMLGGIGGHLGRKSDGPPGAQCLWRGIQRLDTATETYCIMTGQHYPQPETPHPYQSGP